MRCLKTLLSRRWLFSVRGLTIVACFSLLVWFSLLHPRSSYWKNRAVLSATDCSYHEKECTNRAKTARGDVEKAIAHDVIEKDDLQFVRAKRVLIFAEYLTVTKRSHLVSALESYRIEYDAVEWNELSNKQQSFPQLVNYNYSTKIVNYAVFIFESLFSYIAMDEWRRNLLLSHCRQFHTGLMLFVDGTDLVSQGPVKVDTLPMRINYGVPGLSHLKTPPSSRVLRTIKNSLTVDLDSPVENRTVFLPSTRSYQPIAYYFSKLKNKDFIAALYDSGEQDHVEKVFLGFSVHLHWSFDLIFIDSLTKLSNGVLGYSLERNLLVDVDDVFVPREVKRPTVDDVKELVKAQDRLAKKVPGFHFNMGFSGHFYDPTTYPSDFELIKHSKKFWWFCHTYMHHKPHTLTYRELKEDLLHNKKFAEKVNISFNKEYSVAPHHSGVYPVYEPLYDAWKSVLGIKVTSTEEYPGLYPARKRRGFIYKDIQVLPRQVCGIYTRTLKFPEVKGGKKALDESINGGTIFMVIMHNPINVLMTHYGNYGQDRLGLYLIENMVKNIQAWTNIKLVTRHPTELGPRHFSMFPNDKEPIWQNPFASARHVKIWPANKTCNLPQFVIIGPQKTGTTALHSFLSMHPSLRMNLPSPSSYEEVQFFNGNNYLKGLDWYTSFFPVNESEGRKVFFEKSATYFDAIDAPHRMHALVPKAKIIAIIIDPVKRAYSWYQHSRSKSGSAALRISFYDLVSGDNSTLAKEFQFLRSRCLHPGLYAQHLELWLQFYKPSQILIVDGNKLRTSPPSSLDEVQKFIGIDRFDYGAKLRYDKQKGFFCRIEKGKNHCLGKGKGRHYPPMDPRASVLLKQYYKTHNLHFARLLNSRLDRKLPAWLAAEIKANAGSSSSAIFDY